MILQLAFTLAFSSLIGQVTNEGKPFKDPFAEDAPTETVSPTTTESTPAAPSNVQSPAPATPSLPAPATPTLTDTPSTNQPVTPAPTSAPTTPTEDPQFEEVPLPNSIPPAPTAPGPQPAQEEMLPAPSPSEIPKKDFAFPQTEEFRGAPIDRNVMENEYSSYKTRVGSMNIGLGFGAGLNLNKRHQQVHMELNGGYRWFENFEVGAITSFRFVKDKLIGLLLNAKGFYPVKETGLRMDLSYGLGFGWTLRAAKSNYNEGRLTIRPQVEWLMYPFPYFAIDTIVAYEGFLLSAYTNRTKNLMSDPPSQIILAMGVRWEF